MLKLYSTTDSLLIIKLARTTLSSLSVILNKYSILSSAVVDFSTYIVRSNIKSSPFIIENVNITKKKKE